MYCQFWGKKGNPDYCHMTVFIVYSGTYPFLEKENLTFSKLYSFPWVLWRCVAVVRIFSISPKIHDNSWHHHHDKKWEIHEATRLSRLWFSQSTSPHVHSQRDFSAGCAGLCGPKWSSLHPCSAGRILSWVEPCKVGRKSKDWTASNPREQPMPHPHHTHRIANQSI